jgi:flagellar hook-associated protein 1 FlgK
MNAAQMGLATTEHNIANASTPGYTRQQVMLGSRAGQQTGSGFVGQGVDVTGVIRIYDAFLNTQVLQEQNQASYLTAYHSAMTQIDNLIADPIAGVSPAMQSFFESLNGVANNPESVPARQTMLGNSQLVVNRFQAIDQRLTDIANGLTGQIASSVNSVNNYAQQIATLNGSIKRATASGQGQQPNDLIDQRDQLITKLNQEIKTTVLQQSDGTVSVFAGSGQALVVDEQAMRLQVIQSVNDPSKVDVAYINNGRTIALQQSSLQGGNLGAYLTFRDQTLEPARNALGRVALGMAASINQQNQFGQDLNGAAGGPLFNAASPRVDKNANNNSTSGVPTVTISNVADLTTSDYQLRFTGGTSYTLLRVSDNVTRNFSSLPQTVDGMTIAAPATVAVGDSFLIRPTANGARDIRLATTDPAKIATALSQRAVASISATTPVGNTATVAGMTVSTPTNTNLTNPVSITFIDATSYNVTGAVPAPTNPVSYIAPANITYNGWTMQFGGAAPAAGDVFNVGANSGAAKVNTGALNLNPVSINFTGANAFDVVEMRGTPPSAVTIGSVAGYVAGTDISYNGWTVQIAGVPATGDVFNVAKGSNAGAMMATPASANAGTGSISGGTLSPQPFTIMFNDPATSYTVSGATPAVVGTVPYTTGQDISYNGWTIQVTGAPAAGDVFSFAPNTNASGDNRNGLLLAGLQTQNLMANGTASLQGVYSQLVGEIGSKTNEMAVTSTAQANMVVQTVAAQQSVSGVNLDEEAANLIRYQKAYQAAAKAMQIAQTMFDAIMAIK